MHSTSPDPEPETSEKNSPAPNPKELAELKLIEKSQECGSCLHGAPHELDGPLTAGEILPRFENRSFMVGSTTPHSPATNSLISRRPSTKEGRSSAFPRSNRIGVKRGYCRGNRR